MSFKPFAINILLFFCLARQIPFAGAENTSLTLVPPGPVSDKIKVSIRGAVWNHGDQSEKITTAFYLDDENESALLHSEKLTVPPGTAKGIYFTWPVKNHVGKHRIIFTAKSNDTVRRTIRPLEILRTDHPSRGVIDGAWCGFYHWSEKEGRLWNAEIKKMTGEDWQHLVRAMHDVGMNIIVGGEMFRNQMYVGKHSIERDGYKGKAFYPSQLFPGRMPIACKDPMEMVLSEADSLGMHVFVPVGLYAWFDFTAGSLQWHKKVAAELWQRYGHHPSFYGWYVSEEIAGQLSAYFNDKDDTAKRQQQEIVRFFKEFQTYVRSLAPDKPVMLASNSFWINRARDVYPRLLPYVDILCTFGFHRMPKGDISGEDAAALLSKLCTAAGTHLWMDMEVFLFGDQGELFPRPVQGVISDLTRFTNFEKVLCYQFPGLMNAPWASRKPGGPATVKLYTDYKRYYLKKTGMAKDESLVQTDTSAFKNPDLPIRARVNDLLRRMTLQEKVDLVAGKEFQTKANLRLDIPPILMTDGPLGPNVRGVATNYSAMINLAAAFDTRLMRRVAENIGEETRIMGRNMLLAPMINIIRTPFGGRAFELFSEDPFLTSRMAVAYVKGVQSKNVISCTKVIAANNQEWNRFDVDVRVSERALREIYLPAIRAAVQEADSWSIMAAYNSVNGDWCCENTHLLTDILKNDWGFSGFVVTDWGGARSTVKMANSGLDLEMPVAKYYGPELLKAIQKGKVKESTLNDKVRRILRVMFKAGLFDEFGDSYGGQSDTPERRALALETARKSIVLLKNENSFLPLNREKMKSIAVIGPNGDVARMKGGGSGALQGHYGISPLQGIKEKAGENAIIKFQRGIAKERMTLPIAGADSYQLPDGRPGIYAEYFNNRDLEGKPALTRIEKAIDFDWGYGGDRDPEHPGSPQPGIIQLDKWSARWTGKLKSPGDGWYDIGLQSDNGVRLYIDGKKMLDSWIDSRPGKFKVTRYKFQADRLYNLKVEFYENMGSCLCKLGFARIDTSENLQNAVNLAKNSDVVVLCLGLNENMEGEAMDREHLELPENQLKLLQRVTAANKNTMVVLNNGTPILMNDWIDHVPAVIEAFYPGQEGGHALADILFGDINPSGKLPMTLPKRWQDCPAYGTYPGTKQVADYREGIFVGYRWFDKKKIAPLFPFGYGLSYSTFKYSDLKISPRKIAPNDTVVVQLKVTNTGDMAGDEIVQLYVQDVEASVEREVKALKGFQRVSLVPGESKMVSFKLAKSALAFYDVNLRKWKAEPGKYNVLLGSSSRNILLRDEFLLE